MGIPERKEREKEMRRQSIIDAAEKVFFSKGLDSATMDDVAEEVELSKGTLYLYFKSKEELYFAITKRGMDILTAMFQEIIKKKMKGIDHVRALGNAYYDFSKQYPNYFLASIYFDTQSGGFDESDTNALACEQQGMIALGYCADALKEGIEDGSVRADIEPMKAAVILWGLTTGLIQMLSLKGEHLKTKHELFQFKDFDELVSYSFDLISSSLEAKE